MRRMPPRSRKVDWAVVERAREQARDPRGRFLHLPDTADAAAGEVRGFQQAPPRPLPDRQRRLWMWRGPEDGVAARSFGPDEHPDVDAPGSVAEARARELSADAEVTVRFVVAGEFRGSAIAADGIRAVEHAPGEDRPRYWVEVTVLIDGVEMPATEAERRTLLPASSSDAFASSRDASAFAEKSASELDWGRCLVLTNWHRRASI